MQDLHHLRQVYDKGELLEAQIPANPIELFHDWLARAEKHPQIAEANAMSVATVEEDGCPRTRMLLLKAYMWEGFVFYTNYLSRKGRALDRTHKVCLQFFWPPLEQQIIIKANAEHLSPDLSTEYFHSRPRGSQLGALASPQSSEIPDREFLEQRLEALEKQYADEEIPRPETWGGYIAKPYEIEFWQGRPNRLHDRILYRIADDGSWQTVRLAP